MFDEAKRIGRIAIAQFLLIVSGLCGLGIRMKHFGYPEEPDFRGMTIIPPTARLVP